ncbi:hypothetical protein FRC18_009118 [Serendipita sp. 400]|nr:hypothetical protein FRC18_009118 [Serendipita sp. 400]
MSNYTGGARIGPVSGSRRTAFTSKGLAVSARQETISVPSRPRFDFFHANDASERIVNTGSGPLIGRIDAVSPESIRDPPKPPPNQTKFHASSPYMGYDGMHAHWSGHARSSILRYFSHGQEQRTIETRLD